MGLFILLCLVVFVVSDEECDKSIFFRGKHWSLTKIFDGHVSSAAIDIKDNLYYIEKQDAYLLAKGEKKGKKVESGLVGKNVTDIYADFKGNVYFSTDTIIYVIKSGEDITEEIYKDDSLLKITLITSNNEDLIYFLADRDKVINVLGKDGVAKYVNDLNDVARNLAVDSHRNFCFTNSEGEVVFYDRVNIFPVKGLKGLKTTSITMDKYNNALFATQDGCVYDMEVGCLEAKRINNLNIPGVSKMFVDKDENIYLTSDDPVKGGIYLLKD